MGIPPSKVRELDGPHTRSDYESIRLLCTGAGYVGIRGMHGPSSGPDLGGNPAGSARGGSGFVPDRPDCHDRHRGRFWSPRSWNDDRGDDLAVVVCDAHGSGGIYSGDDRRAARGRREAVSVRGSRASSRREAEAALVGAGTPDARDARWSRRPTRFS